jgi:hypothetical protein
LAEPKVVWICCLEFISFPLIHFNHNKVIDLFPTLTKFFDVGLLSFKNRHWQTQKYKIHSEGGILKCGRSVLLDNLGSHWVALPNTLWPGKEFKYIIIVPAEHVATFKRPGVKKWKALEYMTQKVPLNAKVEQFVARIGQGRKANIEWALSWLTNSWKMFKMPLVRSPVQ